MQGVYRRGRWWWLRFSRDGSQVRIALETTDEVVAIERARRLMSNCHFVESMEIADEVEAYCAHLERLQRSPNTVSARRSTLSVAAKAHGPLKQWSRQTAERWIAGRFASVAPSTAHGQIVQMGVFFRWLVKKGAVPKNPLEGIDLPKARAMARKRVLTHGDVASLFRHAKTDDMRFILYCALHAGLRKEEIIEARPSWFDLRAGLLHLQASETWQPKDRDNRTIPLTEEFREFLAGYGLRSPYMIAPEAVKGKFRYRYDFRREWECLRFASGLRDVQFHDLRRTFASLAVSAGVSIFKVARWLGDGVAVVEKHYGHLTPSDSEINKAWKL